MKKVEKVVVNFFLVVTLLLVKIEGIEFRSAAFQYGLDDIDGAFSSNSFDIKFKKTWLDEKAKGSDLPFMVLPENEAFGYNSSNDFENAVIRTDSNVQIPIRLIIKQQEERNLVAWNRFNDSRALINAVVSRHTPSHSAILVSKGFTADSSSLLDLEKITKRLEDADSVFGEDDDYDFVEIIDFLSAVKNPKHLSTARLKEQVDENHDKIIYSEGSISLLLETVVTKSRTDNIYAASEYLADSAMNLDVKYLSPKVVGMTKVTDAITKINAKLAGEAGVFAKKKKVCVSPTSAYEAAMVPINRKLSALLDILVLHLLFPVGTDAECKKYIKNVRSGPTDKITAQVLQVVRKEIVKAYGHPGFIPGFTFTGSIVCIVVLTVCSCILLAGTYLYIKTKTLSKLSKLKNLDLEKGLDQVKELAAKVTSLRNRHQTNEPEAMPMTNQPTHST